MCIYICMGGDICMCISWKGWVIGFFLIGILGLRIVIFVWIILWLIEELNLELGVKDFGWNVKDELYFGLEEGNKEMLYKESELK